MLYKHCQRFFLPQPVIHIQIPRSWALSYSYFETCLLMRSAQPVLLPSVVLKIKVWSWGQANIFVPVANIKWTLRPKLYNKSSMMKFYSTNTCSSSQLEDVYKWIFADSYPHQEVNPRSWIYYWGWRRIHFRHIICYQSIYFSSF